MGLAQSWTTMQEQLAAIEGLDLTPYSEFGASLGAFEEGSSARVAELESVVAELQQQNSLLKAQNYDLLMSGGPGTGDEAPDDEPDDMGEDDGPSIEDYED